MGWCSATEIFDIAIDMLEKVVREFSGPAAGEQSITDAVDDLIRNDVRKLAEKLRDSDWDCTDESEYYDRFAQEIEGWSDAEYAEYLANKISEDNDTDGRAYERLLAVRKKMAG